MTISPISHCVFCFGPLDRTGSDAYSKLGGHSHAQWLRSDCSVGGDEEVYRNIFREWRRRACKIRPTRYSPCPASRWWIYGELFRPLLICRVGQPLVDRICIGSDRDL